ncbi:Transcription factor spt8 [Teratosphaeriaceae sp. CCFEE 6253]|nr:Transcription factor spt8 [Teratosphaeriaceae sp. CCFEE 6253]
MADFDDADPAAEDDFENEDEEMEDANEADQDGDADADADEDAQGDEEEDEDGDNDEDDNGDDEDEDEQPDSPSRRPSPTGAPRRSPTRDQAATPAVVATSPLPQPVNSPRSAGIVASWIPPPRAEALAAQSYDIVPTMACPQSTSINAVAATPDMRWVFSGGTDGYVRMFNWVETANGKVPLTVAQKHPFVDSVMKAGSLLTYWENEDSGLRTPVKNEEGGKGYASPIYALAVHHQALWLLSGLESGGINLQTCRHQAGTRITTLREHTSAVSVLTLSSDETQLLSGSWDKNIHDWDLQTGKVKRSFIGADGQISAIEGRPASDVSIPEIVEAASEVLGNGDSTFSSSNDAKPLANGSALNANGFDSHSAKGDDADAAGSPDGSLFGDNDHGSLFGEDNAAGGGNAFGDDAEDNLTRALANGLRDDQDASGEIDVDMGGMGMGEGGPVQPVNGSLELDGEADADGESDLFALDPAPATNGAASSAVSTQPLPSDAASSVPLSNGVPAISHAHPTNEPLTAPPTNESTNHTFLSTTSTSAPSASSLPTQSESVFLSTSINGNIRLWDRRVPLSIATLRPSSTTPPWCTGACWSPDGNTFYAGRRNNSVEEFHVRMLSTTRNEPSRRFQFHPGSGPVYAVRAMPNDRSLVCASHDILRIYDLQHDGAGGRRGAGATPFTIVPGHRGGVISSVYVDPACRFMLSAAGNRGWEGGGTEVLLGYEIGCLGG